MNKSFIKLTLSAFLLFGATLGTTTYAQSSQQTQQKSIDELIIFEKETYDFGDLNEGDEANAEFVFKNNTSETIVITNVRPSCGCTTPFFSKDPIAPGETGVIHASYGTKGRPGYFNKRITVNTSVGDKNIWIKGNVNKTPTGSVPANNSMLKSN